MANGHIDRSINKTIFFQKFKTYVKNGEKIVVAGMLRFLQNETVQITAAKQLVHKILTEMQKKLKKINTQTKKKY